MICFDSFDLVHMAPKISIIIPTYNRAQLLEEAITSVVNQTQKDFEIIVADGSSTDNTKEVVISFGKKIKYYNEKHTGLPASGRNIGLKNASGKYIAFLDSDDIWLPTKLENQMNYLKSNPHCGMVYSNTYVINEKGNSTGKLLLRNGHAKEGRIFLSLLKENFIPTHTVMMKREVFEKIGYFNNDPSIKGAEDYEYWLRASLDFDIGFINKPLALYRVHTGSASYENNSAAGPRQNVLRNLIKDEFLYENSVKDQICRFYFSMAVYEWRKSNISNAKKYIKKYISCNLEKFRLINVFLGLAMYFISNFKYNNFVQFIRIFEDIVLKLI